MLAATPRLYAQGTTAFTYHGQLSDQGLPARGVYDLTFTVYDAAVAGTRVGETWTNAATVVTNGGFNVMLDFGSGVFTGPARWLELGVRTNGAAAYVALAPRQALTPIPYALMAGGLSSLLSATQISGTLPAATMPFPVVTNSAGGVTLYGTFSGSGSGLTNLGAQSVSLTNLSLDNSLRIACANIDAYGIDRFGWARTLAKLATNGPLFLATVGNGWAQDSEFGGFVTNLLTCRPLAGYASDVTFYLPSLIVYGPNTGNDTALTVQGDDTNWHGSYLVLTNTGSISAPGQTFISDVCGVHFLANPNGGVFALEIRTNGASPFYFTDLDGTWRTVATASASNPGWAGRSLWWTNAAPGQTQIRVRATTPGWTPIVGYAQWNSTITNGVVLCQYARVSSGNWWSYTDPNKVFPIWRTWQPDLIFHTGGFDNSRSADAVGELQLVQSGFPGADIVDVGCHVISSSYDCSFERQFCFANGIPFFDGQAASIAAWGGYHSGVELGLYQDTAHLTAMGYATFSQLLWSWIALTSFSPASQLASPGGGVTTNLPVVIGTKPATLFFTNGLLMKVQ